MKTSLDGVSLGCCSRHSRRALATSSRACSVAWSDFFKGQIERGQRLVHQSGARRDLVRLKQPSAQLGDRCIGAVGHLRQDRGMQASQLGCNVTALRPRLRLSCHPAAGQNFGNVGHADTQHGGDPADRFIIVLQRRRHGPEDPANRTCHVAKASDPPVIENRRPANRTSRAFRNPHFCIAAIPVRLSVL